MRDLAAAGVGLLAGSDTTNFITLPGFDLDLELSLLVAAGLTPLEDLQTATINPARFFDTTAVQGTVAAGKAADLVVLDANPLLDIHHTTRIHGGSATRTPGFRSWTCSIKLRNEETMFPFHVWLCA